MSGERSMIDPPTDQQQSANSGSSDDKHKNYGREPFHAYPLPPGASVENNACHYMRHLVHARVGVAANRPTFTRRLTPELLAALVAFALRAAARSRAPWHIRTRSFPAGVDNS